MLLKWVLLLVLIFGILVKVLFRLGVLNVVNFFVESELMVCGISLVGVVVWVVVVIFGSWFC